MNNPQHITQEEWELIEQYLDGKLDAEALITFENKRESDPSFAEKINIVQQTGIGIEASELKSQMNQFHQQLSSSKQQTSSAKVFSIGRIMAIAAVFIAVAVGIWIFNRNNSSADNQFASFYKPDPGMITAMSQSDYYDFEKAMVDYKSGKYKEAIAAWEKQIALNPSSDTLHYFLGNAFLADGQSTKAIEHLIEVTKNNKSYFHEDAYWYLGLAYLKEGKNAEAKAAIGQSSSPQKEALLKKIK